MKFLALYTEAPSPNGSVILAHGLGVHPDWGVIGTLRVRLADRGYNMLSLQMPALATTVAMFCQPRARRRSRKAPRATGA